MVHDVASSSEIGEQDIHLLGNSEIGVHDHLLHEIPPQEWFARHVAMMDLLSKLGIIGERLALQTDVGCLLDQLLAETGIKPTTLQWDFHHGNLKESIAEAVAAEPLAKRVRGDFATLTGLNLRDAQATLAKKSAVVIARQVVHDGRPPKGTRARLGSRRFGITTQPQGSEERKQLEIAERERWIAKIIFYFREGEVPVVLLACQSVDPDRLLRGAVGKTRGGTLRSYTRIWEKLRKWQLHTQGVAWVTLAVHLVDYLHILREEPCARTVPQLLIQAVSWFERAAGIPRELQLSKHPTVLKTLEFCLVELYSGAGPTWKAPRFPAIIMLSLEIQVCTESVPYYLRFVSFLVLLLIWMTLRFSDVQHSIPRRLRMVDDLLYFELLQTKTTGAGKRTQVLPAALWEGSSLSGLPWLQVGLVLLRRQTDLDRDFLFTQGTWIGVSVCTGRYASYSDASCAFNVVLDRLMVPTNVEGKWIASETKLIPERFLGFWTLHSGRSVMPSLAALLSFDKQTRDNLGRWSPAGSDDYVRTYRLAVAQIQKKITKSYHAGMGLVELREGDICDALMTWLTTRREVPESEAVGLVEEWSRTMIEVHQAWKSGICISDSQSAPTAAPEPAIHLEELGEIDSGVPITRAITCERLAEFLVVFGKGRKTAKLHRARSGCYWSQTELVDCELYDEIQDTMYDSRCKHCWPELRATKSEGTTTHQDSSGDESESDTGSSSEDEF